MIGSNYIPEKINEYNVYLDGTKMIGVASSHTLPEVNMQTSTVSGMGVNGEIDSPTLGQFEKLEQEIQFNSVVFPEPLAPIMPKNSPSSTRKEMPFSASVLFSPLPYVLVRLSTCNSSFCVFITGYSFLSELYQDWGCHFPTAPYSHRDIPYEHQYISRRIEKPLTDVVRFPFLRTYQTIEHNVLRAQCTMSTLH